MTRSHRVRTTRMPAQAQAQAPASLNVSAARAAAAAFRCSPLLPLTQYSVATLQALAFRRIAPHLSSTWLPREHNSVLWRYIYTIPHADLPAPRPLLLLLLQSNRPADRQDRLEEPQLRSDPYEWLRKVHLGESFCGVRETCLCPSCLCGSISLTVPRPFCRLVHGPVRPLLTDVQKNGAWGEAEIVKEPFVQLHVASVALNYGQSVSAHCVSFRELRLLRAPLPHSR